MNLLRWIGYIAAAAFIGVYFFLAVAGPNPITSIPQTQRKIRDMEKANEELRREVEKRNRYLDELMKRQDLQDREIRKGLGKQKDGDTTFFYPD